MISKQLPFFAVSIASHTESDDITGNRKREPLLIPCFDVFKVQPKSALILLYLWSSKVDLSRDIVARVEPTARKSHDQKRRKIPQTIKFRWPLWNIPAFQEWKIQACEFPEVSKYLQSERQFAGN